MKNPICLPSFSVKYLTWHCSLPDGFNSSWNYNYKYRLFEWQCPCQQYFRIFELSPKRKEDRKEEWIRWKKNMSIPSFESAIMNNVFNQVFKLTIFFLIFSQETICIKCQSLFSGKIKKNMLECCLLKFLPSMQSVEELTDLIFRVLVWSCPCRAGQFT